MTVAAGEAPVSMNAAAADAVTTSAITAIAAIQRPRLRFGAGVVPAVVPTGVVATGSTGSIAGSAVVGGMAGVGVIVVSVSGPVSGRLKSVIARSPSALSAGP
jgi:hypothetical protein